MLELADYIHTENITPPRTLELVFTVGEEASLIGAINFDMTMLTARQILVFDWLGTPAEIIRRSPAMYKIDVEYIGKDAHPAEWQKGKNAGAALMKAASQLQQGEYMPGVTFNIGRMEFGDARNKVPGFALLKAETRSYDQSKVDQATQEIMQHFERFTADTGIAAKVTRDNGTPSYQLDESSQLLKEVKEHLTAQGLTPRIVETYGGFDANVFASRGIDAIILGAGYYNPHSPEEYVDITEFTQLFELVKSFVR
jgi:Di- and tripeptidases